jgi:hypothetical protein
VHNRRTRYFGWIGDRVRVVQNLRNRTMTVIVLPALRATARSIVARERQVKKSQPAR